MVKVHGRAVAVLVFGTLAPGVPALMSPCRRLAVSLPSLSSYSFGCLAATGRLVAVAAVRVHAVEPQASSWLSIDTAKIQHFHCGSRILSQKNFIFFLKIFSS